MMNEMNDEWNENKSNASTNTKSKSCSLKLRRQDNSLRKDFSLRQWKSLLMYSIVWASAPQSRVWSGVSLHLHYICPILYDSEWNSVLISERVVDEWLSKKFEKICFISCGLELATLFDFTHVYIGWLFVDTAWILSMDGIFHYFFLFSIHKK